MLTKSLIKFKRCGAELKPSFVDVKNRKELELAQRLINYFASAVGKSRGEIEEESKVDPVADFGLEHKAGYTKLLWDRCSFEGVDTDEGFAEKRWKLLTAAEKLRQSTYFDNYESFQETFEHIRGEDLESLGSSFYGDLPSHQNLVTFASIEPSQLLERYNVALVQGLLFHARSLAVQLTCDTLGQKRLFLQNLRFHRLLINRLVTGDAGEHSFELEGPLSLFGGTKVYGQRLANFFPRLILLGEWSLEASIEMGKRGGLLRLDHSQGLKSHYREQRRYIPLEFEQFLEAFKREKSGWRAGIGQELYRANASKHIVPDFCFQKAGQKVYLELFHRWHRGELFDRVKQLKLYNNLPKERLLLGLSHHLMGQNEVKSVLEGCGALENFGFKFRDFPLPSKVISLLNKVSCSAGE